MITGLMHCMCNVKMAVVTLTGCLTGCPLAVPKQPQATVLLPRKLRIVLLHTALPALKAR